MRNDAAIKNLGRGKEAPHAAMGVYAGDPSLCAMAAVENVDLVVINAASVADICRIYSPGACSRNGVPVLYKSLSWSQEVVPRLLRQHATK